MVRCGRTSRSRSKIERLLPALGHLSITVNDADRERAEEIIAAYERGDFALEDED